MILDSFQTFFFIAFLGLFFGSFLNVLADRLSHGETLLGRSHCDTCKHALAWNDLIPVVSYSVLKGKCRYCRAPFSIQYPLAEIATSALFLLTWILSINHYHSLPVHVIHVAIVAVLIVMMLADLRYQILPDEMQIALLLLAIARIYFLYSNSFVSGGLKDAGIGALVVMAPLLLLFTVTRGRGMGFGDVKYAFVMGALLGMWSGLAAMYIAFVIGGVIGGILLLLKRGSLKTKIAFGPFLILGTYLMLFFDADVILFLSRIYRF